ncbi:MAG: hypothetical protein H0W55_07300 [Actinobacteria bacterium]|nr:hypothetical protein [Actinomycetota bacterium]
MAAGDEVVQLRAEVERLAEGSEWKRRIATFLMTAEADGTIQELVDQQVRLRMAELCRTEDRYMELSEALSSAGLSIHDGTVYYRRDGKPVPISDLLAGVRI